jgi:ATP-dependent NAD(P)H-hydrate dehydratase
MSIVDRVHVVVMGPGLGRDPITLSIVQDVLEKVKGKGMPVVLDAVSVQKSSFTATSLTGLDSISIFFMMFFRMDCT